MKPDFGTYHHSTPKKSQEMRQKIEKIFCPLLLSLYSDDSELEILDAGCGLGFMTSIAAKCFPKSRIYAVDVFQHDSLSEATIEKAISNIRLLGIESRVGIVQHDLREPLGMHERFDLAVSNLVFHNLGKKRFLAYDNVFSALKPGGYFVLGDLFPFIKKDVEYFDGMSSAVQERWRDGSSKWSYRIISVRKK